MIALSLHTSFDIPLSNPFVWVQLVVSLVSVVVFYYVEEYWAKEPVVPMSLLKKRTPTLIMVAMGFCTSCLLLFFSIPFFFKNHCLLMFYPISLQTLQRSLPELVSSFFAQS